MASIAPYLDPTLWHAWLNGEARQLSHPGFWLVVAQLTFIDLLLSGDNAVVIALACRGLPPQQRRWGIVLGAGVAVALRIIFVGVLAWLMLLPWLKLVGGAALIVIAARVVVPEQADRNQAEAIAHLWRAVAIIALADIVMSLDNMVAIAAIARGNFVLLAIGLAISIPLIMVGAAIVLRLTDRLPILVWAGAGLLGWIAGEIMATDPAVAARLMTTFGEQMASRMEMAASGAGVLLAIGAGGLWRSLRPAKTPAVSAGIG